MDAEMIELLQSGCALIVGAVTAAGAPCAGRGWGLVLDEGANAGRLLLDGDVIPRLGHLNDGFIGTHLAVTGCDILTYRSLQLKGPVTGVAELTDADHRTFAAYCDAYFGAIETVDNIPRAFTERMTPVSLSVVTFDIVDVFDQSPGPEAGRAVAR